MPSLIRYREPTIEDGTEMWQLAHAAGGLDANTAYAYVLWCRDFAGTSIVARDEYGELCGFVTGYRRPEASDTLFVWQVAVAPARRGEGIGGHLLDELIERVRGCGVRIVEATVTPSNTASAAMFAGAARRAGLTFEFPAPGGIDASVLPGEHEREDLVRLGPR